MIIVTWNINSLRLRMILLKKLMLFCEPDVICLQETKTDNMHFPLQDIYNMGYRYVVFSGEKSYNGVAIISKVVISSSYSLNFYNRDKRHICAIICGIEIHNFYVPAGGDVPDVNINAKFKHKLIYLKTMINWFKYNKSSNHYIVVVGDFNVAPFEHDVWSSIQLRDIVSHTIVERELLLSFKNALNFIDTFRYYIPYNKKLYTWWSYRNRNWLLSNKGRRLDHIWITRNLKCFIKSVFCFKSFRCYDRPSDHIPCVLDLGV